MSGVKMIYSKYLTTLRKGANQLGIVKVLDRWASHSRFGLWLRSLLSIWDLRDFLSLDLPWWTFKSIDLVERFLRENPEAKVFEWGSGASTVWLAKRSKFVISAEHDQAWASELGPHLPDNAKVSLFEPTKSRGKGFVVPSRKRGMQGLDFSDYCQSITGHASKFDVIVLDGRAREECLKLALQHLEPGGIIVFDNVERLRYRKAIANQGDSISVRWTVGLTPCLPYPTATAIITRAKY